VNRIGFDRNRLEGNSHDPESALFHDIMVELDRYLAAHSVPNDPPSRVFRPASAQRGEAFRPHANVHAFEDARLNFEQRLEIAPDEVRLIRQHREPDPIWPDRPRVTRVAAVTVNQRQQFVVQGDWTAEVDLDGSVGPHSPVTEPIIFWRISDDVLAMRSGGESYETFRRVTDPTGWEISGDASVGATAHGPSTETEFHPL
jgi:hypothetical protein